MLTVIFCVCRSRGKDRCGFVMRDSGAPVFFIHDHRGLAYVRFPMYGQLLDAARLFPLEVTDRQWNELTQLRGIPR